MDDQDRAPVERPPHGRGDCRRLPHRRPRQEEPRGVQGLHLPCSLQAIQGNISSCCCYLGLQIGVGVVVVIVVVVFLLLELSRGSNFGSFLSTLLQFNLLFTNIYLLKCSNWHQA